MKARTFQRKLKKLGLEDQGDAAEAIYGDREKRYNISRYVTGARPVPALVVRMVEVLEKQHTAGGENGNDTKDREEGRRPARGDSVP